MRNVIENLFNYPREMAVDIRIDMDQRLWPPRAVVDWFTGKPILDGKSRPNRMGPLTYLGVDLGILAAATAAAAAVAASAPAWAAALALPSLWAIQVGRLRKMQTLEGHEAAHGNFFMAGDRRRHEVRRVFGLSLNDLAGELATSIALSPNVLDYKAAHDPHHAFATFTSPDDPDTVIVRGLSRYLLALADPAAYVRDLIGRLRSNLVTARPVRRAMALGVLAGLGGLALTLPFWAWFAAILLPWAVLFRLSGALQIMSLHDWRLTRVTGLQDYADRTWARFSGAALPARGLRGAMWVKAWALWWAEMLFIELPFRVGVLSPDLQAHDAHHLEWIMVHNLGALSVFTDDWRNPPYRRAEMIRDSGDPLGMASREFWGVRAFIRPAKVNLRRLNG
jgi:hypothetical protein